MNLKYWKRKEDYVSAILILQRQPPLVFYKKDILKNFAKLQQNTYDRVSLLIKLQRDSGADAFLWVLQTF